MAGTTFAALIPLVKPLDAVALFAVMTGDLNDEQRRREATKAGIYTGIILAVTAVAGAFILDFSSASTWACCRSRAGSSSASPPGRW